MTLVLASAAVCPPGPTEPGWIAIDGRSIVEVGRGDAPPGATDLSDAVLAPAFVDLQCNGVGDVDLAAADAHGWQRLRSELARHGTGAFLATFVSAPLDAYGEMLAATRRAQDASVDGSASILGVHLEGPFLGGAPGAHDPTLIRRVDGPWLAELLRSHPDTLRMMTLAPEADPELAGTRALAGAGVVVALGHSRATYDEALGAARAGATVVTHLFDAMGPLHHREPGLPGAALDDASLTPTLIADLVHVHPAMVRLALARAPDLAVVSDAVAVGTGLEARDGAAWSTDGTLAGATTLLDGALANLLACGVALPRAVETVTSAPARILGLEDRGRLCLGARADVVALDPRTAAVRRVWMGGVELAGSVPV